MLRKRDRHPDYYEAKTVHISSTSNKHYIETLTFLLPETLSSTQLMHTENYMLLYFNSTGTNNKLKISKRLCMSHISLSLGHM